MGIDPYRSKDDLFLEKTNRAKPTVKNFAMELGNRFEGPARALLYFELDIEFEPITVIHSDLHFIRASLDGYNLEEQVLAEIKYMGTKNFDLVKTSQATLVHHYPQVQQQLAVTGFKKAIYTAYTLNKPRKAIDKFQTVPILRDEKYINEELLPALKSFWDEVTLWIEKNQSNELSPLIP